MDIISITVCKFIDPIDCNKKLYDLKIRKCGKTFFASIDGKIYETENKKEARSIGKLTLLKYNKLKDESAKNDKTRTSL